MYLTRLHCESPTLGSPNTEAIFQQVSGINVVIYFGPQILKEAGFGSVQATALTAVVSTAQLIAVAVLMRMVDRVGRRPMAFIGLLFMIVGLAGVGYNRYNKLYGKSHLP